MKTYDVKYSIGDSVYININKIGSVNGIIDSFRIIETKLHIKIHYLVIIENKIELEPGVYKNFEWISEENIFLNKKDLELYLENQK